MTDGVWIKIEFTTYWLSSTGGSGGMSADTYAHRDMRGLPALPMTSVKGRLRETAARLFGERDDIDHLFGSPSRELATSAINAEAADRKSRELDGHPAQLHFIGDARLPKANADKVLKNPQHKTLLFRTLTSTKIDDRTGTALDKSLRTFEVCIPLTLFGRVEASADAPEDWRETLDHICACTTSLGRGKSAGLGRAIISIYPPLAQLEGAST